MGFSMERNMNKTAQNNDEREEGEIIDDQDFEDIISSDEEFSMRKRIEELEARNLELEKIANISGIYNFDISKQDVGYPSERHRNGMVTLDLSDIGDYHKTSNHIKKRSTKKHPLKHNTKATAANVAAAAVGSGFQTKKRRRRNSTSPEDLHLVKSRITIPSPIIKSNYEKNRKRKYEKISRNKWDKRKPEKVKKKISKLNNYSSSDDEICALNRDELRMALKRDSRTPNFKSSFNSIRKSFDLQSNAPIPVIDLDKDDDNFYVDFRGVIDKENDEEADEKRSLIESDDSVSIEEQELRLIALKSAVLKKHLARKKRKENEQKKPYSPTDFLGINSSPKPPIFESINCNSMDISPVESPEFFTEDCSLKPVDMDLVDGSDSDTPIFIGESTKTTQWTPIHKLPLTESIDNIAAPIPIVPDRPPPPLPPPPPPPPITRSEQVYTPTNYQNKISNAVEDIVEINNKQQVYTPAKYHIKIPNVDEDIVEINNKSSSSPEPTDEEELALRALLLSKLNSPKQSIIKTKINTNTLQIDKNVNNIPEKILALPTVDQQPKMHISDHDTSLDAESLRNFLLSTMKKKPINETEFVLKEAVRRLQGKPTQHRSDDSCDNSRSEIFIEEHNTLSSTNSSFVNNNNNNNINAELLAKDVECIVNVFQNVTLEGTSLEDHYQKILKDTESYANDSIQPSKEMPEILNQQQKIKTHVTRRPYKTDKKDLGAIVANSKINNISNINKLENNTISNQNVVVIDPASNFNPDIANTTAKLKISKHNYSPNSSNTIQIRLTASPTHTIVPAKIIKKSSTKLVNTQQHMIATPPIPTPAPSLSTITTPVKISSPISTKSKLVNKTLLRTSIAKTNSINGKNNLIPITLLTKTTTGTKSPTAAVTATAPKTVIPSITTSAVKSVTTTIPAAVRKQTTTIKTEPKLISVIKPISTSRLITSFIGRPVNKMIIHVSRSDSESDLDGADVCGASTSTLTSVANEYFDNASPKSFHMGSPCSSPMTVSNSVSVPNAAVAAATAAAAANNVIISQATSTNASTNNSVDNKENRISDNQVVNKSVVNDVFQARLDQLLRNARKEAELIKKDVPTTAEPTVKPASDIRIPNTPLAVRHLPASSQLEYRRLISRMKILERQRAAKNTNILSNKNSLIKVTINNEKAIETKLEQPPILKVQRSIVTMSNPTSKNINTIKIENTLNEEPLLKKVLIKNVTTSKTIPTSTIIPTVVVETSVNMPMMNTMSTTLPTITNTGTDSCETMSIETENTDEKIVEIIKQDEEVMEEPLPSETLRQEQTAETTSEEIAESTSTKKEEPIKNVCEEVISLEPEDKLNLLAAYESGHQINSSYLLETIIDTLDIVTKAKNEKLMKITLESDIKKLKHQLFRMEKDLEVQNKKIAKIYPEIANSHKVIVQLQQKCTELHKLSANLGKQIIGKSYNLKIEHTSIINEKSKQLKLEINKLKNLKRDSENDDDYAIQDEPKPKKYRKISEKQNSPTKKVKQQQQQLSSSCNNNTIKNDNNAISSIHEEDSNTKDATDNISSKMISENVPKKHDDDDVRRDDKKIITNSDVEITVASCTDNERTTTNQAITSKNDLNRCNNDDEEDDGDHNEVDVLTEENNIEESTDNCNESLHVEEDVDTDKLENTNDSNRTKVEYISPLDHMSYETEINPNGIICPYELMGQCDDKECNYEHFKNDKNEMT